MHHPSGEFPCFFVTDLHGRVERYEKLFAQVAEERPQLLLLGGDLLPRASYYARDSEDHPDFVQDYLAPAFRRLRDALGESYPAVFLILGNDDPRVVEPAFMDSIPGLWQYLHGRKAAFRNFCFYGYACVPPTPFLLKDWERYDVSRYVDPGCISPEEGQRTVPADPGDVKWGTIQNDLAILVNGDPLQRGIFLMHTPPYDTPLDRAALDGKSYEHVPLDVHIGSIAVRRFIEQKQPLLTLHGHVHESTRLTGEWKTQIGRTVCINGAHDGPELAIVHFNPESPAQAMRELI
jgi:Icc-related predicted phosphoesterase